MFRLKYFLFILATSFIFVSCSDDSINKANDIVRCKLLSYTDSANYYYEVEYKDDQASSLYYYRFDNNEVGDLVRQTEIYRNFLGEITYINYKDSDGNLNFVDSVYSNSRGIPYEIVTYNNIGEFVEKVIRVYNNQYQVITESNYKYDETWKLLSQSNYQYDVNDRLIDRQYQQFNDNGSRSEHSTYEYDNMKNINKIVDLFTLFNKNNRIKETTTFTSRDSLVTTSIKTFVYDYNEEGYPYKVETSSSSNENVSVRFNTIICD